MASEDNDQQISEEKARFNLLLARWRGQLLIDETENDADAIELDRRVLDYYLDQYNELDRISARLRDQIYPELVSSSASI